MAILLVLFYCKADPPKAQQCKLAAFQFLLQFCIIHSVFPSQKANSDCTS